MHEVTIRYDEALLREAVRRFYLRTLGRYFGWSGLGAMILVALALAFLLVSGDRSWFVGAIGATLVLAVVVLALGYGLNRRNTLGRFAEMRDPCATFVLRDADFTVSSDRGAATLPWSAVSEIWEFQRFWLLLFSRAQFVTLPTEGVSAELLAFLRGKVRTR